jgi:5-methylcytosine-specific restriction endonuclease McrA
MKPKAKRSKKTGYYWRHREEILAAEKAKRLAHPEIHRERGKRSYAAHREEYKVYQRQRYHEDPVWHTYHQLQVLARATFTPGYMKEYHPKWRKANPDRVLALGAKFRADHPDRVKASSSKWAKAHPERACAYEHNRRTKLWGAGGSHTAEAWVALKKKLGNCCLACGATKRIECDHIWPVSLSGPNDLANLQPLCCSCNRSKGVSIADYRPFARYGSLRAWLARPH